MTDTEKLAKLLNEPARPLADDVIEFFAAIGISVFSPWQRETLARVFAEAPGGKVAERNVRLRARGEGELNTLLARIVTAWLFLFRAQLVLWSVNSPEAERAAFEAVMSLVSGNSLLAPKVQHARHTAGNRELRLLPHGAYGKLAADCPRFLIRRRPYDGRGVSASRLIISQAEDFGDRDAGLLLPVAAGVPDPQLLWCSTVPPALWHNTALGAE